MIPIFQLPSDPKIEIQFREATVSDAIEFSGKNPNMSEVIETIFLNTIQDHATYRDSSSWTINDRKTAIAFYAMNVSIDNTISVNYNCPICKGLHEASYETREIMESYVHIKGRPLREDLFDGKKIIIRHINGSSSEKLQELGHDKTGDKNKDREVENNIKLMHLVYSLDFPEILEPDPNKRSLEIEGKVRQLPFSKYQELTNIVAKHQIDMNHGIDIIRTESGFSVVMPPIKCRKNKGGEDIVLHSPFRYFGRIPMVD